MTIATTANAVNVYGNGSTYQYSFSFVGDATSDINVSVTSGGFTTQLTQTAYTISFNSILTGQLWSIGGTVTYPLSGSPLPNTTYLTIERILPLQQLTSLTNQGNYNASVVEEALDTLEMQIQQVANVQNKAIQFPVADSSSLNAILPDATARASQYVAFDSLGNVIVTEGSPGTVPVSSVMQPVVEASTLLLARYLMGVNGLLVINVKDYPYLAIGDGVTDDTLAIQAAIAAANNAGGGIVFFPEGSYLYTSSSFTAVNTGVTLLGVNRRGSIITTNNATAEIFYLEGYSSSIKQLGFKSTTTSTGGAFIQTAGTANVIDDVYFSGDFTAINITGVEPVINNLVFDTAASGAYRIIVNCGDASPKISNVIMNAQSAPYATCAILLSNVVSLNMTNIDCINQGNGLLINPGTGQSVLELYAVNCRFDSSTYGVFIQTSGTGSIAGLTFVNLWGGNASNTGIFLNNASGILHNINFTNIRAPNSATAGFSSNGSCDDITIMGGLAAGCVNDGFVFNHTGSVKITNVDSGNYAGFGANGGYGINFDNTGLTSIVCEGNSVVGNTTGAIRNISTSTSQFFTNNVGYNPLGPHTITVGSSPFTYSGTVTEFLYIYGGTVSSVTVAGASVASNTNTTTLLSPGQSVVVAYSAVPVMIGLRQ